ncbi:hypothetical protein [Haladaptatus caseinilyticus]|nr:hypothetical protein [Haladaptatus caseinilyticus]
MNEENDVRRGTRQTGPWVLALGVLAVGTVALVRERRRNGNEVTERP